jgi:hypothetical protein
MFLINSVRETTNAIASPSNIIPNIMSMLSTSSPQTILHSFHHAVMPFCSLEDNRFTVWAAPLRILYHIKFIMSIHKSTKYFTICIY